MTMKRIVVALDRKLLARLDALVRKRKELGTTRTALIREAIHELLKRAERRTS